MLTFIDVETTGLSPKRHEIIEIGALEVDRDSLEEIRRYSVKVRPTRLHDAEPKALQINGYTAAGWADAMDLAEALVPLDAMIQDHIWVGHNPTFDQRFIEAAYQTVGRPAPIFLDMVDTKEVASAVQKDGMLKFASLSLTNVAAAFGLRQPWPHRALDDAMLCWQIVKKVKVLRESRKV